MQYGEERNSRHISRTHPPLSRIPGINSITRHALNHLPTCCTSIVVGDCGAANPLHLSTGSLKKQYGYAGHRGSTPSYNSYSNVTRHIEAVHQHTTHTTILCGILRQCTLRLILTPMSRRTENHYNLASKEVYIMRASLPPQTLPLHQKIYTLSCLHTEIPLATPWPSLQTTST